MIKASLGTMEMGRNATVGDVPKKMVELFLSKAESIGADEIDTAFMYVGGKTEKVLGRFHFIFSKSEFVDWNSMNEFHRNSVRLNFSL